MPDWEALNAKQTLDREIVGLATQDLRDFLSSVNLEQNAPLVKDVVTDFMVQNVQAYGQASASVSAEFYDATRNVGPGAPAYRAEVAPIIPTRQIERSTAWAVTPLFQETADVYKTTRNLLGLVDRLVKQQGRDTLAISSAGDPVRTRYARILSGSRNCYFCVMLASRGAVYRSKSSASKKSGSMDRYHPFCDCIATPIRSKDDYPDGYDLDELYQQYKDPASTTQAFRDAEPPPNQWLDPGDPVAIKYGVSATDRADAILSVARPTEQRLTERLVQIAEQNNGEMHNLDFRLKTRDSLARKLKLEFDQLKLAGADPNMADLNVSDVIRYTMLTPSERYASTIQSVVAGFESEGYSVRVKNYWRPNSPYKGVNMAITDPSGQVFELQMHTFESQTIKDQSWKLYEVSRATNDLEEKARLELEQRALWATLPDPPNIEQVGNYVAD